MKVTRNTPDQLIVDHYSIVLAIIMIVFFILFVGVGTVMALDGALWGLLFVAGGFFFGGAMLYQTERVQVILDRSTGLLTIRRRNIMRYSEVVHDLDALDRAMIETSTGSEDNSQTFRATLVLSSGMSAGKHPITEVYTSVAGPVEVANEINAWLRQGKTAVQ